MIAAECLPRRAIAQFDDQAFDACIVTGPCAASRRDEQGRDGNKGVPLYGVRTTAWSFPDGGLDAAVFFHVEHVTTQAEALHDRGQFIAIERAVHTVELCAGGQRAHKTARPRRPPRVAEQRPAWLDRRAGCGTG